MAQAVQKDYEAGILFGNHGKKKQFVAAGGVLSGHGKMAENPEDEEGQEVADLLDTASDLLSGSGDRLTAGAQKKVEEALKKAKALLKGAAKPKAAQPKAKGKAAVAPKAKATVAA